MNYELAVKQQFGKGGFMSRAWRIEYEGAFYHLMSRGNEGGDIFLSNADRKAFLDTIGEMSDRFGLDVHTYVLNTNPELVRKFSRRSSQFKASPPDVRLFFLVVLTLALYLPQRIPS